jgi:hypothetical protein
MFLSISKSVGNRITDGFTDETDASVIIFLLPTELPRDLPTELPTDLPTEVPSEVPSVIPSVIIEKYFKKIHFIKL